MPAPPETPTSFLGVLEQIWWRLDTALDLEMIRASARLGALEALECGTTALIDHHESPNAIEGSLDVIAEACAEVGVRCDLAYGVTDRHGADGAARGLAENERYLRAGGRGRVGVHAAFTCSDDTLAAAAGLAADLGVGLHIHVAEGPDDLDAATRLAELSRDDWLIVHGVHLPDDHGVRGTLVHNPRSNMNNRVGRAPIARGRWQLGTDGIDNDILAELRAAYFRGREDDPPVDFMAPLQMMREAQRTMGRAFDLVLDELRPGAGADLTVLRYDEPTPLSAGNFAGHLYFGLDAWAVAGTVVRGRFVLRDGAVVSCDEGAAMESTREGARRLYRRMEALS